MGIKKIVTPKDGHICVPDVPVVCLRAVPATLYRDLNGKHFE